MELEKTYRWNIVKKEQETPLVSNFYLEAVDAQPAFIAGQYLTVRMSGVTPAEGKAYSISSTPNEKQVRLSIKAIGAFSKAILALEEGAEIVTSAPYGFFYPEPEEDEPLVFVVGGIGITPCLSIIKTLLEGGDTRPLQLHYSNKTRSETAFYDELQQLAATHPSFTLIHYLTKEVPQDEGVVAGRMTPTQLLASVLTPEHTTFFLCGSMHFTKSLWKELHAAGVPQHQLYTEGFF